MDELKKIKIEEWGKTPGGETVYKYNASGRRLAASFISFGATIQRMTYDGMDIIFSMPDVKKYAKFSGGCTGATVGRYAGRIAGGQFEIDGVKYKLPCNQHGNHIHGGKSGFNTRIWHGTPFETESEAGVEFSRISPDGEEGYPGNMNVSVRFSVTKDDCLKISYTARTDAPTVINLTNHSYFNLNGFRVNKFGMPDSDGNNSDIEFMLDADYITELHNAIPTGSLIDVSGTPFDFRSPKLISEEAFKVKGSDGYDHNFVLNNPTLDKPCASAFSRKSGLMMECFTDQPGAQFFSLGTKGPAFALETQHFPDSPNHPDFPKTVLRPDEIFRSTTIYKFIRL